MVLSSIPPTVHEFNILDSIQTIFCPTIVGFFQLMGHIFLFLWPSLHHGSVCSFNFCELFLIFYLLISLFSFLPPPSLSLPDFSCRESPRGLPVSSSYQFSTINPLNVLILNVQRFNSSQKWTKAFRTFATFKAQVVYLQETPFIPHSMPKFLSSSYQQVFTALVPTKHGSFLIVFHLTTLFAPLVEIKYPEGRYLILTGFLLDVEATVVSYYSPNKKPLPFLSHLLSVIDSHKHGTLLICGNFNYTLYHFLDKSPQPSSLCTSELSFQQLLHHFSFLDSWREQHPSRCQYMHYSYPHKTFFRIDYICLTIGSSSLFRPQYHHHYFVLIDIYLQKPDLEYKW